VEDRAPPRDSRASRFDIALKFAGTHSALEALWRSAIAPKARATRRRLVSTYFDTSDYRLRRRGFALRVRQEGDGYRQTVFAVRGEPNGAARSGGEWSAPLETAAPDLTRIGDPEVRERIGLVIPGELAAIFTTDVTRQAKRYRIGRSKRAAQIEAIWERGELLCGGRKEAICELELAVLDGSPAAAQREAVRLLETAPLACQPLSQADRGFALALGEPPQVRKADTPSLARDLPVEDGLERILTSCVTHWLANHAAVLDGRDPEGVHQMRVALRRLRSALTIFKDVLPADDRAWLQREAKFLIGGLGGARDWDVFVEELLSPVLAARPDDEGLKVLEQAVSRQRRLAYERAWQTLGSPRYLKFALELEAWLIERGWRRRDPPDGLERRLIELAAAVLDRRHRKAIKLGRKFDRLSDDALHRLRISLKKLRYATEFFATLHGKGETKPYLASLRRLQDDLGHLNDLAVAEARLTALCAEEGDDKARALELPSGTVIGWHSHALARVRPRIAKDWRAFARAQPFWRDKTEAPKP
jgi:triphosphatase